MGPPGYNDKEKTGILSTLKGWHDDVYNHPWTTGIRNWSKEAGRNYDKQLKDAGNSYTQLAKNNTSNFEKIFGESNFSNKAQAIARGGQDLAGYGYNVLREGVGFGADIVQNANAGVNDLLKTVSPFHEVEGPGKATQTALTDTFSDLSFGWLPRTDMFKDGFSAQYDYNPGTDKGYQTYTSWKDSTGFNTTLNADRINLLTEKDMKSFTPDVAFPEYQQWLTSEEFKSYSPEVQTELLSDRKRLFDTWYDETRKIKRAEFDQKNEWRIAGPQYAEWASKQYQNEMLGKYGKYELSGFDLNPNISPQGWEDVDVKLSLANDDYIEAYNAAGGFDKDPDPYDIGYPTEFDYGYMDRSPVEDGQPGLTTAENDRAVLGFMKPYNYNTPEAEALADNPLNVVPELFVGGKGLQTLGSKVNKYSKNLPYSRAAREMFPGTLQFGPDDFGFAKKAGQPIRNFGKSVVNQFRRKGGQFATTMYATDYLSGE